MISLIQKGPESWRCGLTCKEEEVPFERSVGVMSDAGLEQLPRIGSGRGNRDGCVEVDVWDGRHAGAEMDSEMRGTVLMC